MSSAHSQTVSQCLRFHKVAATLCVTLAMNEGGVFSHFLRRHARLENVRIIPYSGTVAHFLLNTRHAQQAYIFSEPLIARREGATPRCLLLADLGYNPYTSCLLTTDRRLAQEPDLVARVVRASLRGWQRYATDPALAHVAIHAANPEMPVDVLDFGHAALAAAADQRHGLRGHPGHDVRSALGDADRADGRTAPRARGTRDRRRRIPLLPRGGSAVARISQLAGAVC